ncbi:MAG TPA: hypothetical protein VG796_10670 [Verrucomicrobiales bacterium]|jgi:hypothetical protein|nr:hypothetical protein [Verrucomicrobiales bacterium]
MADILRAGAKRLVEEFEAEGCIRFGQIIRISYTHADMLTKYADFLEVTPQVFTNWNLDDVGENLSCPWGILHDWVDKMLIYETRASERRVRARLAALVKEEDRKQAKAEGGPQ